jgi:hypothetical protein
MAYWKGNIEWTAFHASLQVFVGYKAQHVIVATREKSDMSYSSPAYVSFENFRKLDSGLKNEISSPLFAKS